LSQAETRGRTAYRHVGDVFGHIADIPDLPLLDVGGIDHVDGLRNVFDRLLGARTADDDVFEDGDLHRGRGRRLGVRGKAGAAGHGGQQGDFAQRETGIETGIETGMRMDGGHVQAQK
jgi:hypothetical protein